ncbi:FecCD family ABC transporter permease [Marinomonas balearica]|uniref:Iron complex transport system permease protein n=1 Tax=Marinomonas balearica TaxID=491947 RepID=A0A4R6M997_9GAMM|nr:iron ABC transporter permease [Marinomonas balearica]TDO98071.1 iron complex transport system permease protein [Marinomonas balearica]
MTTNRPYFWLMVLMFALAIAMTLSMMIGPVSISLAQFGLWLSQDERLPNHIELVLGEIRLTRTLLAALVGASLSMSGAAIQGVFRNPLADPGLIGVSSGAAFFAVAIIVMGDTVLVYVFEPLRFFALPLAAFLGGVSVTWIIYLIGSFSSGNRTSTMILAGIAIQSLCLSGIGLFTYMADDAELRTLTFWTLGSFSGTQWSSIHMALPWILVGIVALPMLGKWLNVLLLGENVAGHLGVPISLIRKLIFVLAAMCVGASVAVSGVIGFFGLVVPHLVRLSFGPDHRWLLPYSGLFGATLMLVADLIARTVAAPAELPVGIITALMGGPFFLWLIIRFNRGKLSFD